MDDVTIAILAGGRSRRMGQNKSLVTVQGKPMIEHIIEHLTPLNCSILFITQNSCDYEQYKLPMVPDRIPDQGALGGIYTALYHSSTPYVLCTACDMPFLNIDVLRSLLALRERADGVAAYFDDTWQTFPAVYSTRLLTPFREAIDGHHLRMQQVLSGLSIHPVSSTDLSQIDPHLRTFTNINTPDELQTAQIE